MDGLELVLASLYVLAQHRAGRRSGVLPWAALLVGTAASLAANVAVGGHEPVGRAPAGWPAVSLLVSIKLLFSMFDHASNDHRTVQGTVPDDTRPSGTTGGPGTDGTRPAAPVPSAVPGTPGARPGAGAAGRGGAALDVRDVADLIPAARAARTALAATGRRLSRDALADRMRDDGHAVSNARACLLVKILKAEDAATPFSAGTGTFDDESGESPDVAA